jgi:hypothetical protein
MHKHSKGNCKILKDRVNDLGLAFAGRVELGTFWTLVQVLSYVHALQLTVSSCSSFRHGRISTIEKIYTRMQMNNLLDNF